MKRIVQVGHPLVAAIHCQGILNKIVGANAEKIHLLRQLVGHHCRRRDLAHRAHLAALVIRHAGPLQFGACLGQHGLGLQQFFHARYHRKHELDVSMCAGSEDGTQLNPEQVSVCQGMPDGAPTQKRIRLFRGMRRLRQFVAAQVQRAHHQRMRRHL